MNRIKKQMGVLLVLIVCTVLGACSIDDKKDNEMYVYYLNADGNALLQEVYPKMDIKNTLDKLKSHTVLTNNVALEKFEMKGTCLDLYFSSSYFEVSKSTEVLTRAAIVQTLTQIDGVDFVRFYVNEQALVDSDGDMIGMMRAEDFVQNTGSSIDSYQTTDLTLYFADKDGKQLKTVKKENVRYNANTSIERLVMEQLMKGTNESGKQSTIPPTTVLLGVSVRDEVCYVNLDSKFSLDSYALSPEVAIYSIVNSLIANGSVNKVQILIDGANDVTYKNTVDLSKPLGWNEELFEKEVTK